MLNSLAQCYYSAIPGNEVRKLCNRVDNRITTVEKELGNSEREPNAEDQRSNSVTSILQTVEIPRWIVYFQAALLGIIATTFFIFGLMVGSLTSGVDVNAESRFDVRVSGTVEYRTDGKLLPDEGAVIFLLPKQEKPDERAAARPVSPAGFRALDNPGIEIVHQLGGAIVRADENGKFNVLIDGNAGLGIDYHLLVVSRNCSRDEAELLTKQQVAAIGTFFMPVERLVNDQAIYWSSLTAREKVIELPKVEFKK